MTKILFFFLRILFLGKELLCCCLSVCLPSSLPGDGLDMKSKVSTFGTFIARSCSITLARLHLWGEKWGSFVCPWSHWVKTAPQRALMKAAAHGQKQVGKRLGCMAQCGYNPTSGFLALSSSQTCRIHPQCRAGSRCHCPLGQPSLFAARPGSLTLAVQLAPQDHYLQGEKAMSASLHHTSNLFLECWQKEMMLSTTECFCNTGVWKNSRLNKKAQT